VMENPMRSETIPGHTTLYVFPLPPALPETIERAISRQELAARSSDPLAEHDSTLLLTALEHLEAQRAAIEWLRDADLMSLLLV
jgi:hypothetical protein